MLSPSPAVILNPSLSVILNEVKDLPRPLRAGSVKDRLCLLRVDSAKHLLFRSPYCRIKPATETRPETSSRTRITTASNTASESAFSTAPKTAPESRATTAAETASTTAPDSAFSVASEVRADSASACAFDASFTTGRGSDSPSHYRGAILSPAEYTFPHDSQ